MKEHMNTGHLKHNEGKVENKKVSKKHQGQKRDKEITNRDTVEKHLQKEHTAEKRPWSRWRKIPRINNTLNIHMKKEHKDQKTPQYIPMNQGLV